MNKILITGGAGFIGSALAKALGKLENEIIIYDNLSTGSKNSISSLLDSPKFTFMEKDMLDLFSLAEAVGLCDLVFHLAANPEVRIGLTNTTIDYEQNVHATYNLLEAMRKSVRCKKLIFASTSTIYGDAQIVPTAENYAPLSPISLYGASKLACEALISGYSHMFNMSSTVIRLANVVGPESTHGVIYDFVNKLSSNTKYLEILGDGKQNKSYLYIEDSIDAFIEAAKIEKTFEIVNAGSSDKIDVTEIAKIVIKELSLKKVDLKFTGGIEGRGWKGDVKEMLLDSSKLEDIGWSIRFSSSEAVMLSARGMIRKNQDVL